MTLDTYLTSGKVAKLFGVAPKTANKWCDKRLLACHRVPGSQDRRIRVSDLFKFAKDQNFPISQWDEVPGLKELWDEFNKPVDAGTI